MASADNAEDACASEGGTSPSWRADHPSSCELVQGERCRCGQHRGGLTLVTRHVQVKVRRADPVGEQPAEADDVSDDVDASQIARGLSHGYIESAAALTGQDQVHADGIVQA